MLARNIMTDLGQEYCELLEEGHFNEYARDIIREKVRNEYDGEIWELVEDEENTLDLDFDDILSDICDEIESLGNTYYENIQAGN